MRKYWEAFMIAIKTRSAYRFDMFMQVIGGVARVLFAWLLWSSIYKNRTEVAGFTLDTMILYYLIQSFFAQTDNTGRIAEELIFGAEKVRSQPCRCWCSPSRTRPSCVSTSILPSSNCLNRSASTSPVRLSFSAPAPNQCDGPSSCWV